AARADLERAAGVLVFELLGAPPSVPGLRLSRALATALEKAGVRSISAIAERSADGQVQIVRGVECEPVRAGAMVLASGRFLGGGIGTLDACGVCHACQDVCPRAVPLLDIFAFTQRKLLEVDAARAPAAELAA